MVNKIGWQNIDFYYDSVPHESVNLLHGDHILDQFALQPWHDVSHFFIRIRVVKRWCSCPIMEIKYQMGKLTIFYTIFSA